jgi:DNA-binding CsgD family transcriptional regulator
VRTTRRQREILRLLCNGRSQATIARRIEVSERKLTEEIAGLKSLWGVSTMNELVFQFAQSPDCRVDDRAPAAGEAAA